MAARRPEADRMVEALTRLDQTDALVEQILGDSKIGAKFHASTCACNFFLQQQSSRPAVAEGAEPIHYPIHTTESASESELDWDPECVDDDVYPLADENRSTLVPVP